MAKIENDVGIVSNEVVKTSKNTCKCKGTREIDCSKHGDKQ